MPKGEPRQATESVQKHGGGQGKWAKRKTPVQEKAEIRSCSGSQKRQASPLRWNLNREPKKRPPGVLSAPPPRAGTRGDALTIGTQRSRKKWSEQGDQEGKKGTRHPVARGLRANGGDSDVFLSDGPTEHGGRRD